MSSRHLVSSRLASRVYTRLLVISSRVSRHFVLRRLLVISSSRSESLEIHESSDSSESRERRESLESSESSELLVNRENSDSRESRVEAFVSSYSFCIFLVSFFVSRICQSSQRCSDERENSDQAITVEQRLKRIYDKSYATKHRMRKHPVFCQ